MRHDNAFVIGADNRVGLPVSDAAFCGDNRRPLIDIDAVRNQPAPRILALAPVVFFAAVTQVKIQRAAFSSAMRSLSIGSARSATPFSIASYRRFSFASLSAARFRNSATWAVRRSARSSDAAIRGHVFCSFLALTMQKYLEDLSRRAGVIPEWKTLLRDLDRPQHVRIRHRDNDWLARTDVFKSIANLFHHAHIALPPRARQMVPPRLVPDADRDQQHHHPPGNAAVVQAWCHVVTNFAESSVISIDYRNQVFK